jgi:transcription elongation GreA/GreB family factor
MNLKHMILAHCRALIAEKLESQHRALKELTDSAGSDTKSSAGDKFETSRAMLHIEQDNIRKQQSETMAQKAVLDIIDPERKPERIGLGSLVKLSGMYYFISTALGKMNVEGQPVIALSAQSPLGSKLIGLHVGDRVELNGREMGVDELT